MKLERRSHYIIAVTEDEFRRIANALQFYLDTVGMSVATRELLKQIVQEAPKK